MSALPEHDVALVIGGRGYLGWTEISIDRGMNSISGSFDLSLAAKERTGAEDWEIADGAPCQIMLAGEVLITGYVDSVVRFLDAEERGVRVTGRDKAADLVDCSAMNSPGSWQGRRLEQIAAELAEPFGIALDIAADTGEPFAKFALQQGETVFAAIERMARYRGLVAWSPGDGTVRIDRFDQDGSMRRAGQLREGVNVKRAQGVRDVSERFSEYTVKGQASGSDRRSGRAVSAVSAKASDAGVGRYRPLLIVGEEQSDRASLQRRADWEAAVRSGRATPATITTAGWFDDDGKPWQPATRSACNVPGADIEGDLLIERVSLTRDAENGTEATMDLVPVSAWSRLPETQPENGA